jgi:hypothetical protein
VFVNRPEWVNRFGKTLGDLPLFGDLQMFVLVIFFQAKYKPMRTANPPSI